MRRFDGFCSRPTERLSNVGVKENQGQCTFSLRPLMRATLMSVMRVQQSTVLNVRSGLGGSMALKRRGRAPH